MDQIILDITGTPTLRVAMVAGDLRLNGWEQNKVFAQSDQVGSLHVDKDGEALTLRADADCSVRVPQRATVTLDSVAGDARLKALDGAVTLHNVDGDLTLRLVGPVTLHSAAGDVSAKKVNGTLRAAAVSGDVLARSVAGDVEASDVTGDLYLRDVTGSIRARAAGDVELSVEFTPGHDYAVEAAGDLICRLSASARGRFEVECVGNFNFELSAQHQIEGEGPRRIITLGGSAEPVVRLKAAGDLTLTMLAADPDAMGDFGERFGEDFGVMAEELAAQIETQIESQMADFERTISERLAHLGTAGPHIRAEEIASKARRAAERVEQAARRRTERQAEAARRRVEAAQRRAEREADRARRLAEAAQRRSHRHGGHGDFARGGSWSFGFTAPRPPVPPVPPMPPVPPTPPADPVSDEERMLILRMLEQGKISVADAEQLLAALEGKGK
jgi:hypothetical protein